MNPAALILVIGFAFIALLGWALQVKDPQMWQGKRRWWSIFQLAYFVIVLGWAIYNLAQP